MGPSPHFSNHSSCSSSPLFFFHSSPSAKPLHCLSFLHGSIGFTLFVLLSVSSFPTSYLNYLPHPHLQHGCSADDEWLIPPLLLFLPPLLSRPCPTPASSPLWSLVLSISLPPFPPPVSFLTPAVSPHSLFPLSSPTCPPILLSLPFYADKSPCSLDPSLPKTVWSGSIHLCQTVLVP